MSAPYLFWQSYLFDSDAIESVNDIKGATRDAMKEIGLANAKINQYDVNGSTNDTIVAVCYVGLGSHKWMAIVMAAGAEALTIRDNLIKKFATIHWL
jgi:hypothetical protein